jgi:hypothetical protein
VDRMSYSLMANLGLVPQGLTSPALELFRQTSPDEARARWPQLARWPLIRGGDAHRLGEICPALRLDLAEFTVAELALAFSGRFGRSFSVLP